MKNYLKECFRVRRKFNLASFVSNWAIFFLCRFIILHYSLRCYTREVWNGPTLRRLAFPLSPPIPGNLQICAWHLDGVASWLCKPMPFRRGFPSLSNFLLLFGTFVVTEECFSSPSSFRRCLWTFVLPTITVEQRDIIASAAFESPIRLEGLLCF